MRNLQETHTHRQSEAEELLDAIETAETVIVSTIERECEALRAGRLLAARALHTRLCDAATVYLNGMRAARASISALEQVMPGCQTHLEDRRASFSALLKVELAVLATERAAVGAEAEPDFAGQTLGGIGAPRQNVERPAAPRPSAARSPAPRADFARQSQVPHSGMR